MWLQMIFVINNLELLLILKVLFGIHQSFTRLLSFKLCEPSMAVTLQAFHEEYYL